MAGKGYPSNRSNLAFQPDDFGSPKYNPGNDNFPRPKPNFRRPGQFPKFPKRPVPFGRKPGLTYPSPFVRRLPRLGPWLGAAGLLYYYWTAPGGYKMPPGGEKCWDYGGPKDAINGPVPNGSPCSAMWDRLLGYQPGRRVGQPIAMAADKDFWRVIYLGDVQVENEGGIRMGYREKWVYPPAPWGPTEDIPFTPGVQTPIIPDYALPPDPNWWTPLDPTPYIPPVNIPNAPPRPVSPPRTFPSPQYGPVTTSPGIIPAGSPTTTTVTAQAPRPEIKIDNSRPMRPGRNKTERKYGVQRSGFAQLATRLLQLAAGTYGGITEVVDLVSAIYSAIPSEILARYPDNIPKKDLLPHMLGAIYANRNVIDYEEAIYNIAVNQIEDYAWGKYFKAVDDVSRNGQYYIGFDRELSNLNELFRSLQ